MKTSFRSSFDKDLRAIGDKRIFNRIEELISSIDAAADLTTIPHLRKLKGSDASYRIRIGDYRVGVCLEYDTVIFVRVLNRREIYRFFP